MNSTVYPEDDDSFERWAKGKKGTLIPTTAAANTNTNTTTTTTKSTLKPAHEEAVDTKTTTTMTAERGKKSVLEQKAEYELLYAMDRWYDDLKDLTFPTYYVELGAEDTRILFRSTMRSGTHLSEMNRISQLIAEALSKCDAQHGAFVKLNTRSPKDAIASISNPALVRLIETRLKPLKKDPHKLKLAERQLVANDDANLLSNSVRALMSVTSPKEVLSLLQGSSRVASDLSKCVEANQGTVVVVREFQQCVAEDEFRCFVHEGKLTGISQYCYSQYFASVCSHKAQILDAIQRFFKDSFLPRSPYPSCIVDVALFWKANRKLDPVVKMIEINPWFQDTGALLFSWKSEEDRRILRSGFEFRVLESPLQDPYDCLPYEWRQWFMEKRGFTKNSFQ